MVAAGAPVISAVTVTGNSITPTTATVTWTTDITTTANTVEYGVTSALGSTNTLDVGTTSHSAALSGLTANTQYWYRVKSTANGQTVYSSIMYFTTPSANTGIQVSIETIKSSATADNTYAHGWEFKYNITVNNPAETNLTMQFNDWASSSGIIPAAGNMKIALVDNAAGVDAGTVGVAVGNAYTNQPAPLILVDQNPNVGGIQTTVYVYIKVPGFAAGGSYSTNYGIHTQ